MRRRGNQFTSPDVIKREIKISMDGRGAWRGNVSVERLWRSKKYQGARLRAYARISEAHAGIWPSTTATACIHLLMATPLIRPTSISQSRSGGGITKVENRLEKPEPGQRK